jgi:hypothetical protein
MRLLCKHWYLVILHRPSEVMNCQMECGRWSHCMLPHTPAETPESIRDYQRYRCTPYTNTHPEHNARIQQNHYTTQHEDTTRPLRNTARGYNKTTTQNSTRIQQDLYTTQDEDTTKPLHKTRTRKVRRCT